MGLGRGWVSAGRGHSGGSGWLHLWNNSGRLKISWRWSGLENRETKLTLGIQQWDCVPVRTGSADVWTKVWCCLLKDKWDSCLFLNICRSDVVLKWIHRNVDFCCLATASLNPSQISFLSKGQLLWNSDFLISDVKQTFEASESNCRSVMWPQLLCLSSSVNDILSAVDSLSCLQTFMFDWLLPPSLQWSGVFGARVLEAWLWTWGRQSTFWSSVKVRPDQVSTQMDEPAGLGSVSAGSAAFLCCGLLRVLKVSNYTTWDTFRVLPPL